MEAVQKTPEREAFYKKIDGENLSALWNVMNDLITPEPGQEGQEAIETKYRCKACDHEWRVRVAAKGAG